MGVLRIVLARLQRIVPTVPASTDAVSGRLSAYKYIGLNHDQYHFPAIFQVCEMGYLKDYGLSHRISAVRKQPYTEAGSVGSTVPGFPLRAGFPAFHRRRGVVQQHLRTGSF